MRNRHKRYECEITLENADDGVFVGRLYFGSERRVCLARKAGYSEEDVVAKMRELIAWWDEHADEERHYPVVVEL